VNTYPRIPTLDAQRAGEPAEAFGLRAFSYLVAERVPVGLLTREQQAAALHFSLLLVTAPDVAASVLARWADVRHQLAVALATPVVAETAPVAASTAPQSAPLPGGARVARPVPPTRPTPPSAAVSPLTGNPLPEPLAIAARLAAARRRALATPLPEGDAL